jgi:hypothetical protein
MKFNKIDELDKTISRKERFEEELAEKLENIKDTYIYIKSLAKYYWLEKQIFFSPADVQNNLLLSSKELNKTRQY